MNIIKSVGAFILAVLVGAILSTAMDSLLQALGFPPSDSTNMLILALVYRSIFLAVSGYTLAKLAPVNKMNMVIFMGIFAALVTLLSSLMLWHLGNHWYSLTLTALSLPAVYLGGKFALRK